ncbi:MAG: BlaI/MecI/CopY family transcriptional regulator [Woeseiaceae bacterium]|nr:BlaI/MecI/CopY family transcriptional regulator [Woeseiaceae bacterium]
MQKPRLSRREREIMDILLERREATAREVRERLASPPGNSATRALLARLEKKGLITHTERDLRYVYAPAMSREEARRSALERLTRVFFDGSLSGAVTGMVEYSGSRMSDKELAEVQAAIDRARRAQGGDS